MKLNKYFLVIGLLVTITLVGCSDSTDELISNHDNTNLNNEVNAKTKRIANQNRYGATESVAESSEVPNNWIVTGLDVYGDRKIKYVGMD